MLDGLAPARRRLVAVTLGLVVLVVVLAAVLVVRAGTGGDEVEPVAQDRPGPVLLVPGYGASGAGLEELAEELRSRGRTVEVVDPVADGTGDLVAQADALDEAAEALAEATGSGSVDVVGHSAGGVVARLWVAEGADGGGSLARRVVTLGSPHHGTEVADLGAGLAPGSCPEACRQLTTDAALLADLNSSPADGTETPAGPVWVALWTEGDQVVVPASSGRLDGAVSYAVQDVCGGREVTHGDLPSDEAVVAMTLDALGTAVPVAPPPAAEVC